MEGSDLRNVLLQCAPYTLWTMCAATAAMGGEDVAVVVIPAVSGIRAVPMTCTESHKAEHGSFG
jgi:hypothetical protein